MTKKAITKSKGENHRKFFFPQLFWQKVLDMDFPKKVFDDVFELPLLRNPQNAIKKK
jgi:hypothetical protein